MSEWISVDDRPEPRIDILILFHTDPGRIISQGFYCDIADGYYDWSGNFLGWRAAYWMPLLPKP